jgi:RNA polymerase sigma factor (sigma-70 family)
MQVPVGVRLGTSERNRRLSDDKLRADVEAAVRRRIRGDAADDVVQATWTDVLQASQVPSDAEEFRRFVFGVARNKVVDHFRQRARELASAEEVADSAEAGAPVSTRDLLRWAEGKLPDPESKDTLEWMLREGDGEKLEQIAREANLPAPRVRQRVSRLRRFLRRHWAAELLLGGALLLLGAYLFLRHREAELRALPEPRREFPKPVPSAVEPERPAGDPKAAPLPSATTLPSATPLPSATVPTLPSPLPSSSTRTPRRVRTSDMSAK